MRKKWSRQDVVNWMRMINECGCEDEQNSIYGETPAISPVHVKVLANEFDATHDGSSALCPDTYRAAATKVCEDPHAALEAIKPLMREIGVGCPQSFARAIADVFQVGQELGILSTFNTEK